MKYLITNALKNIFHRKASYIFFSIQILISFTIMLVFGSITLSLNADYDEISKDVTAHTYHLDLKMPSFDHMPTKEEQEASDAVLKAAAYDYDDYLWIKENYGHILSVSYEKRYDGLIVGNGEALQGLPVFFVTDEFFRNIYFSEEMRELFQKNTVIVPKGLESFTDTSVEEWNNEYKAFTDFIKDFDFVTGDEVSQQVYFFNYTLWNYELVNNDMDRANIDYSFILPYELFNEALIQQYAAGDESMGLDGRITINFYGNTDPVILEEICNYLARKDVTGQVYCEYNSIMMEFEEFSANQRNLALLLQMISVVSTLITGIGFIGLILVIFSNRRRKLALALVTGAGYSQLYLEIVLEIEAVILSGAALGLIAGIFVINAVNNSIPAMNLYPDITLCILLPIMFAAIGVIISLSALNKLFKIEPNEILKSE